MAWGKEWLEETAPITKEAWDNISLRKLESYEIGKGAIITKNDLAGGPVFVKTIDVNGAEQTHNPLGYDPLGWKNVQKAQVRYLGIDLAKSGNDKTVITLIKDGKIEKVYNNLPPTHDPYTNPNSHIYYQCNCGAILDPGTKSFAALNNAASDAGWKVRWGADTYVPYCVECALANEIGN